MADENETNEEDKIEGADDAGEQPELPGTEAPEKDAAAELEALKAKYEKDLADAKAEAAKAAKKAIADEKKRLAEDQKKAADRAKMEEADRLKAEKADAEKALSDAKAEAESMRSRLALYQQMSASKVSPAAESAQPMIEAAFADALAEHDGDGAAALKAIQESHGFLFAKPEEPKPERKTAKPKAGPTTEAGAGGSNPKEDRPPPDAPWEQQVAWARRNIPAAQQRH